MKNSDLANLEKLQRAGIQLYVRLASLGIIGDELKTSPEPIGESYSNIYICIYIYDIMELNGSSRSGPHHAVSGQTL